MPYRIHNYPEERYVSFDQNTPCVECHEKHKKQQSGLIQQILFGSGGVPTRCRHHKGRSDEEAGFFTPGGWGGHVKGMARRKGCKNKTHHALAFRPGIPVSNLNFHPAIETTSQIPEIIYLNDNPCLAVRTKLPERCRGRTPRGRFPDHNNNNSTTQEPEPEPEQEQEQPGIVDVINVVHPEDWHIPGLGYANLPPWVYEDVPQWPMPSRSSSGDTSWHTARTSPSSPRT